MELLWAGARALAGLDPSPIWSAALVAAVAYAAANAQRFGFTPRSIYWTCVLACLGGLWGGRMMGLAVHGWQGGPFAWLAFWSGDKSYYGGLFGGATAVTLFCRRRKMRLLTVGDALVPAISLGYAIGRLGCFLNGDDYGVLTRLPWAVVFPPGTEAYDAHASLAWVRPGAPWSLPVHPTQLYASLAGLALFVILSSRTPKWHGELLAWFCGLYGATRFLLEWLRGDFRPTLGPFSVPQLISLALIICVFLIRRYGMGRPATALTADLRAVPEFTLGQ